MKRWNKSTRKNDGWVERRRQFQKMFAETEPGASDLKARVDAGTDAPETSVTTLRGEK